MHQAECNLIDLSFWLIIIILYCPWKFVNRQNFTIIDSIYIQVVQNLIPRFYSDKNSKQRRNPVNYGRMFKSQDCNSHVVVVVVVVCVGVLGAVERIPIEIWLGDQGGSWRWGWGWGWGWGCGWAWTGSEPLLHVTQPPTPLLTSTIHAFIWYQLFNKIRFKQQQITWKVSALVAEIEGKSELAFFWNYYASLSCNI